jgi:hypothetical protein
VNLVEIAQALAEEGLPVFPCAERSKAPCIPEAEGGHGFLDATTEPSEVRRLFVRL